jgi:hypothetical protein
MVGSALLRELHDRVAPVTLAAEQLLAVPEPLQPLFTQGGMPRGISVGFQGPGSWSIALALAGVALGSDGWMAVVGVEELGLVAAAELGVRLDRMLLIASMGAANLAPVVAALVEAMDIIVVAPRSPVGVRDARRLQARARERGTVLFHLDGGAHWPEALDLTIKADNDRWEGIGWGHGHLQLRHLDVRAVGRRAVSVVVGGTDGSVLAPARALSPNRQLRTTEALS